jgi:hypothetical protein
MNQLPVEFVLLRQHRIFFFLTEILHAGQKEMAILLLNMTWIPLDEKSYRPDDPLQ